MSSNKSEQLLDVVRELGVTAIAFFDTKGEIQKHGQHPFVVTLVFGKREMTTSYSCQPCRRKPLTRERTARTDRNPPFSWPVAKPIVPGDPSQSYLKPTPPDKLAADVLSCLCSDANSCDLTHDEWCREYGYDTGSIRARDTYLACTENGVKVKRLLGEHFERCQAAEH